MLTHTAIMHQIPTQSTYHSKPETTVTPRADEFSTTKSIPELHMILDRNLEANRRPVVKIGKFEPSTEYLAWFKWFKWFQMTRVVRKMRPIWIGDNVIPILIEVEVRELYDFELHRRRIQSVQF